MYSLRLLTAKKKNQFSKYVLCRTCLKLYNVEDCHILIEGRKQSKICNHNCFPNHKLAYMHRPCSEPLVKDISETGSYNFLPYKVFCYKTQVLTSNLSWSWTFWGQMWNMENKAYSRWDDARCVWWEYMERFQRENMIFLPKRVIMHWCWMWTGFSPSSILITP